MNQVVKLNDNRPKWGLSWPSNWPRPRFGYRLSRSAWFQKVVRKSFEEVDVDKDGVLDSKELLVGLLRMYDVLNSALPCHVKVPTIGEVNMLLATYDVDATGKISYDEYLKLCRGLIGTRKNWRQSLILKLTVAVLVKAVVLPVTASLVRGAFLPYTSKMPRGVATFALETGFKAAVPNVI